MMAMSTQARRSLTGPCLGLIASVTVLCGLLAAPAGASVSSGLISTFVETTSTPTSVTARGGVTLVRLANTGRFVGPLAGSASDDVLVVVASDGSARFSGAGTCSCAVAGTAGVVHFQVFGTQRPDGSRHGHILFRGSGPLAGLVGFGAFAGSAASLPITGRLVGFQPAVG